MNSERAQEKLAMGIKMLQLDCSAGCKQSHDYPMLLKGKFYFM